MNQDILSGRWKELKGSVKEHWGKLTNDHLDEIDGKSEKLVGKLQHEYGLSKEEAEKQVHEFTTGVDNTKL